VINQAERDTDTSLISSAEVKKRWSYISTAPSPSRLAQRILCFQPFF